MENGKYFFSKICHFQYDHRLIFSTETDNTRTCKEVRLQKLIKFKLSK